MSGVPQEYEMEVGTSVELEACEDESILIQTVKNIVQENEENEEAPEEYFVVTNIQNDQNGQIEVTNTKVIDTISHPEENSNWMDMCRVCANLNDHLIPIFEGEGAEHELCNKIHKYLPIHVSETDNLPLQLCYHCAATLLAWHELAEGCLDAERRLLQMQEEFQHKQQPHDEQQNHMKGDLNEETIVNDTERSSRVQTPFKVFLDTQNIFWKPYKSPNQPHDRKLMMRRDTDSAWITVVDATLHQAPMMSDPLASNDSEIKQDKSNVSKEGITKGYSKFHTHTIAVENNLNEEQERIRTKCETCSQEFDLAGDLQEHSKVHKVLTDIQESYQCLECGKCFKLKDSYLRHMRIHTDERPFTCHICGKQFRDSGGLSRHLKDVHAKVKNFSCDICGRSFASKATRDDHRRTHTGERPYICDSCGKTFKSKASLYIHSKLHTDEFPHLCSYCNKKFRRRQEMLAHVTTHTGEKNYGCDVCSKRFRVKSELVRHKLIHSEDKPFVCTKCGLAFRQKRYLNNHIKSRHIESFRNC
ncbi:histone-lysine N-methyltransferase PRDM9 isoform X6 [Cephus cinctus]|uniref:Histone-lysine N-methyltransferase PRDM9 isoform X6 n=1 Tax=Cephus cinctus TaxID=211228 RepID=A0AAJ7RDD7_CEPCN|nr:histone-lysine N-methyltransferase PRDM9 isoform X6 [Cephus cinctus]